MNLWVPTGALVVGAMLFTGWASVRTYDSIQYDRQCEDFILRAGQANSIEFSKQSLDTAIAYLKANGLTSGFTSILWRSPDEDIGYRFNNLIAARALLEETKPDASTLEQTNVLLRLHESLARVEAPMGISVYPDNSLFVVWAWGSLLLAGFGLTVILIEACND